MNAAFCEVSVRFLNASLNYVVCSPHGEERDVSVKIYNLRGAIIVRVKFRFVFVMRFARSTRLG